MGGPMAETLREIENRLLAVMPIESTVDRPVHALAIASVVFQARRQSTARTGERIAKTRVHVNLSRELTRLLKRQMKERSATPAS